MWRNIARIFGPSTAPAPTEPDFVGRPTEAKPNDDANSGRHAWRTVGLTEQRLRAANKQSWITSTKGWSEMLGRFSRK